jgi:uncharacterized protein (TIGR00299 family) protein
MKVLRFDSVGGASGDMILASLIGLGIDTRELHSQLRSLAIHDFEIATTPASQHGLDGIQASVNFPEQPKTTHRNLNDILEMINKSALPDRAKTLSIKVFERLAEAEAKIHATTPDKVHFHEVGAMDSIIDIVGSCAGLTMLGINAVTCGPIPLGSGTTESAHGVIPVPAPATLELLKGYPVIQTDEPHELVTPTGAALLTTWMQTIKTHDAETPPEEQNAVVIQSVSHAFGHRRLNNRPNLLRATILDSADTSVQAGAETEQCIVVECNIDDTVPELLGSLAQKLMENNALDVFTTAVQMKKQRPGTLFTLLCRPTEKKQLLDIIFEESTTFGVREYAVKRTLLQRRQSEIQTPYGKIRVKIGSWKGRDITRAPEHRDCLKCAYEHGVAVRTVYEAALKA